MQSYIKTKRKEKGLSQFAFAKIIGVNQTAVSQWELGKTLPEPTNFP